MLVCGLCVRVLIYNRKQISPRPMNQGLNMKYLLLYHTIEKALSFQFVRSIYQSLLNVVNRKKNRVGVLRCRVEKTRLQDIVD